jgi:hypothetical protein
LRRCQLAAFLFGFLFFVFLLGSDLRGGVTESYNLLVDEIHCFELDSLAIESGPMSQSCLGGEFREA